MTRQTQRQTQKDQQPPTRRPGATFRGNMLPLESRQMMSGDTAFAFDGGQFEVQSSADSVVRVELSQDGRQVRGVVDGQTSDWFSAYQLQSIQITGGSDVTVDPRLTGTAGRMRLGAASRQVRVTLLDTDGQVKVKNESRLISGLDAISPTRETRQQLRQATESVAVSVIERSSFSTNLLKDVVNTTDDTGSNTTPGAGTQPGSNGGTGKTYGITNVGDGTKPADEDGGDNGGDNGGGTPGDDGGTDTGTGNGGGGSGAGDDNPTGNGGGGGTNPGTNDNNPGNNSNDPTAPQPVIEALSLSIAAGQAVHVDAMSTTLHNGQWNDGDFHWDFGDSGSDYNSLRGFVGSHVYARAGQYTITLTVTDEAGLQQQATATVNVAASTRRVIYVDSTGSDSNSGMSTSSPVRTSAKALQLQSQLGDHVEVLFRRGQTHNIGQAMVVANDDVIIGAYGAGSKPLMLWTGEHTNRETFVRTAYAHDVTVRDLTFKVANATDSHQHSIPSMLDPHGWGINAVNNTMYDIGYGVRTNAESHGVLVQGNESPDLQGLRNYFIWGEGTGLTVLGNHAENSCKEHILRISANMTGITVHDNDFAEQDLRHLDPYDFGKAAVNIQWGQFAYVTGNKLRGANAVGPLGEGDGRAIAHARAKWVVWENNLHIDGGVYIEHGAEHVDVRNNVFDGDNIKFINVEGPKDGYTRTSLDITLHNNLGVNEGTQGQFIHLEAGVLEVEVTDNSYSAPNLVFGPYASAGMYIEDNHFGGIVKIEGNTWPVNPLNNDYVRGGVNVFGGGVSPETYRTPGEWNNLDRMSNEAFTSFDVGSRWQDVLGNFGVDVLAVAI